jgi:hypothetical protein
VRCRRQKKITNRRNQSKKSTRLKPEMCVHPSPLCTLHPPVRAPNSAMRQCGFSPTRTSCTYVSAAHAVYLTFLCAGCADAQPCHPSLRLSSTSRTTRSRRRSQPPSPPPSRRARSTPSPTCRRSWPRRPSPWRRASLLSTTSSSRARRPRGGSRS